MHSVPPGFSPKEAQKIIREARPGESWDDVRLRLFSSKGYFEKRKSNSKNGKKRPETFH